jgi:hypothetical protein
MRSVLPLALCLTLIAVLLRVSLALTPPAGASTGGAGGTVSILVASRGHMLPSATLAGGDESFSDAIAVGDLLLAPESAPAGLRVALLGPRLEFRSHAVLPIPERAADLAALVDGAEDGCVLIAAAEGDVRAEGATRAELDEVVRHLGATVSPFRLERNSWALIARREGAGWRALGEVYSRSQEVHLALSLRLDLLLDGRVQQPFLEVEVEGPCRLALDESFSWRTPDSSGVYFNRWARLGALTAPALQLKSDSGRIAWTRVGLGSEARFTCELALGGTLSVDPIVVELLLDGALVASTDTAGLAADGARRWEAPLPAGTGAGATLELRTRQATPVAGACVLLGRPTLEWTATR